MCSFLYLSLSLSTLYKKITLSLINKLFIPVHLILHKLFEEQYSCISTDQRVESCRRPLSAFIFRLSSMQVDIADRCDDCQLMYNKGKQLVFTSNTENVFFSELGKYIVFTYY